MSGLNWQIGCTCNPPQRAEERWIYEWWPNWIDRRRFPESAMPGSLIYFIMRQGKSIQVDGPGFHIYKGRRYKAMSRTFIPSSVRDNMYLDDGQYEGVLESLPEPLRSQLLNGDFQAGIKDDEWQLIPTEWILAAMDRWRNRPIPNQPVDQAGLDVSRGGRDRTMLTKRRGNYFETQIEWPGKIVTDGETCAGLVLPHLDKKTLVTVDIIGVGQKWSNESGQDDKWIALL